MVAMMSQHREGEGMEHCFTATCEDHVSRTPANSSGCYGKGVQTTTTVVDGSLTISLNTIADGGLPYICHLEPGYGCISAQVTRPTRIQYLDLLHYILYTTDGIGNHRSHPLWILLCQRYVCILQRFLNGGEDKMGHAIGAVYYFTIDIVTCQKSADFTAYTN